MAWEGGEGSASCPGRSLPPGKTWYPLYKRLGGPQGQSGQAWKILPPPGFNPWTVHPVASHYTDQVTWPTILHQVTGYPDWYLRFSSVRPGKLLGSTSIMPWLLPSQYFPIHQSPYHSCFRLRFDRIICLVHSITLGVTEWLRDWFSKPHPDCDDSTDLSLLHQTWLSMVSVLTGLPSLWQSLVFEWCYNPHLNGDRVTMVIGLASMSNWVTPR